MTKSPDDLDNDQSSVHKMTNKNEQLMALTGYRYRMWEYDVSHSMLTIKAVKEDKPAQNIFIHFGEVYYLQAPVSWIGDFALGSDSELEDVISKAGLRGPFEVHKQVLSLFKADAVSTIVYILGALISVENNIE